MVLSRLIKSFSEPKSNASHKDVKLRLLIGEFQLTILYIFETRKTLPSRISWRKILFKRSYFWTDYIQHYQFDIYRGTKIFIRLVNMEKYFSKGLWYLCSLQAMVKFSKIVAKAIFWGGFGWIGIVSRTRVIISPWCFIANLDPKLITSYNITHTLWVIV